MKKLLLLALIAMAIAVNAQQKREIFRPMSPEVPAFVNADLTRSIIDNASVALPESAPVGLKQQKDVNFVNPIAIGQAGNAIGFAFMRTTYLWAENNTKAVINEVGPIKTYRKAYVSIVLRPERIENPAISLCEKTW